MQVEKHTLVNDFPEHHHTIRHLKMNDMHFAKLFEQYHQVQSEVHHIEKGNEGVSDKYLESLKKQRFSLKDQLYLLIKKQNTPCKHRVQLGLGGEPRWCPMSHLYQFQ